LYNQLAPQQQFNQDWQAVVTTKFTTAQLDLILIHLIRSPKVALAALNKLKPDLFNQPLEDAYKLIWGIAHNYYLTYNHCISPLSLATEIDKCMGQDYNLSIQREKILGLLEWMFRVDDTLLAPEYVLKELVQPFLDERAVAPAVATFSGKPIEYLDELTKVVSNTRVTTTQAIKLFDTTRESLDQEVMLPSPTGSAVFDYMTDGGARKSHTTGILAPFGGGKTGLCIDICVNNAKQKKRTLFLQYEEDLEVAIQPRIWSAATGLPVKLLFETKYKDLPTEAKTKIKEYEYLNDYLICIPMQGGNNGCGGMREVGSILHDYASMGTPIELICLDWLGAMIKRYAAANNLSYQEYMYSLYSEMLTLARYNIANDNKCELVITHQLNGDAGKRGPASRSSMYDASEFKKFAEMFNTCIIIGKADPNGIASIYTDKNRGISADTHMRIRSDVCKFDLLNDHMIPSSDAHGRITFVNPGEVELSM